MNRISHSIFLPIVGILLLSGCQIMQQDAGRQIDQDASLGGVLSNLVDAVSPEPTVENRVDFSVHDDAYRFSASVPEGFAVEYADAIRSINLYDPELPAQTMREQSQIFIRYFEANQFLTLNTVTIFSQEPTERLNRTAVKYDIEKKDGVALFDEQPSWRNERHQLIDIRYSESNPSFFYVFSHNPAYDPAVFEDFIDSIVFHNDSESLVSPLDMPADRATVKPFGLEVSPDNSPITPERFAGFHTGLDFEIFEEERARDVPVRAMCGGPIIQKRTADGYGGVLTQACRIDDEAVVVVYGHLRLLSIEHSTGDYLFPGQPFAVLGDHESDETDGERKHLHLSVHKGSSLDIRGYVAQEGSLSEWIDPLTILPL